MGSSQDECELRKCGHCSAVANSYFHVCSVVTRAEPPACREDLVDRHRFLPIPVLLPTAPVDTLLWLHRHPAVANGQRGGISQMANKWLDYQTVLIYRSSLFCSSCPIPSPK